MKLRAPRSLKRSEAMRCLRSIVQYDQFDDWLPDPIYFQDALTEPGPLIDSATGRHAFDTGDIVHLTILDRDDGSFSAASVPLSSRVVLNGLVAEQAEKRLHLRNRLFAFGCMPRAKQTSLALWYVNKFRGSGDALETLSRVEFDEECAKEFISARTVERTLPSDEFSEAKNAEKPAPHSVFLSGPDGWVSALTMAARALGDSRYREIDRVNAVLWQDIENFFPSLVSHKLWSILLDLGADNTFVNYSRKLFEEIGVGGNGWVSIDDSTGFLASCYLHPVDSALIESSLQFYRSRDEYLFLCNNEDKDHIHATLGAALASIDLKSNDEKSGELRLFDHEPLGGSDKMAALLFRETRYFYSGSCHQVVESDEYYRVALPSWENLVRRCILSERTPSLQTVVHFLTSFNFLSQSICLELLPLISKHHNRNVSSYLATLSTVNVRSCLMAKLRLAHTKEDWWQCAWLLRITSDAGLPNEFNESEFWIDWFKTRNLPSWLRAWALVVVSRRSDARLRCLQTLKEFPTPQTSLEERVVLVARYFCQKRWGGQVLSQCDVHHGALPLKKFLLGKL